MWTDLIPLPWNPPSWTPDASSNLVAQTTWSVSTVVNSIEALDTSGYFTSIIQDQRPDPADPSVRSLYERLSEMDELLWSSPDFSHKQIQAVFNGLSTEQERIKYMEWLVLRLSLSLQSLNNSLKSFVNWGSSWETREILIWKPSEVWYKKRLEVKDARRMLHLVVTDEEEQTLKREYWHKPVIPILYLDDFGRINKDSRLIGSIGKDGTFSGALSWRYNDQRWITNRYLRVWYGDYSTHESKMFWKQTVNSWEEVIWDINNWQITIHIYNSILDKIRALLLQIGDIGELFNTAREAQTKNTALKPPQITF